MLFNGIYKITFDEDRQWRLFKIGSKFGDEDSSNIAV